MNITFANQLKKDIWKARRDIRMEDMILLEGRKGEYAILISKW